MANLILHSKYSNYYKETSTRRKKTNDLLYLGNTNRRVIAHFSKQDKTYALHVLLKRKKIKGKRKQINNSKDKN